MANESSRIDGGNGTTASPADSYIGSFISLISKYEIRYEGVLYHLNPQDSTLGLKSVRSYGTEGRKKDGPQVPSSDKIYEYILFRGSDIKDLQVKAPRPAEVLEPLHSDPAIIQSKYAAGASNLSRPVSYSSGSMVEASSYNEPSALNTSPDLSRSPNPSGIQMGLWGPHSTQRFSMTPYDLRTHWQGYNGAAGSTPYAQQHSVSSARIPYPVQNLLEASGSASSTTMAATKVCDNVSLGPSFAASNSIYSNLKPALTSMQHPTSPTSLLSSLSTESSLPSHQIAGLNSNRLTMPSFSLASQHVSYTEASLGYNVVPEPVTLLPIQGLLPSTSSVLDSTSDPLFKQPPALVTPNQLSQPRLSEISEMPKLYPDQKDVGVMGSISLNSLSSFTTLAVQQPLLPLPPSDQQLQHLSQFTEEFDFEAMNEKFKKDEVWGCLGKANQRDNIEGIQHNVVNEQNPGDEDHSGSVPTGDPKPAYNKDDFFDTISCNRINHGARNRRNQFSGQMKQNTETFGNFQEKTHSGYSGSYAGGRGDYRGAYNWGRGYNPSGQGRGGYTRR